MGELVVCILTMMIFDVMSGFMHTISVWIDFIAYATMNWCQCIVLIIISCIDLGMLVYSYCKNDTYKYMIKSHWLSTIGFWFMIVFYVVKLIVSCWTYSVWRRDFRRIQGHLNCCGPFYPANMISGQGGANAPMIDSDPERGMRNAGNNPLPFQG